MIELAKGALISLIGIEETDEEIPFNGDIIVGKNGVFKTSSSPVFEVIQPTTQVLSNFKTIEPSAKLTKKVPWNVFWQGPAWLKRQWDDRKNQEYIIILFYDPEKEEYFWFPPRQDGSAAHIDYSVSDDEDVRKFIEEGSMIAGTIHNHFGNKDSAFQSGTDSHDEAKSGATGIHWTMGYMDCKNLFEAEFHIRIVSGDFDRKIIMKDCIEDPPGLEVPASWDEKLDRKPPASTYNTPSYAQRPRSSWQPISGVVSNFNNHTREIEPYKNKYSHLYQKKETKEKEEIKLIEGNTRDVATDGETILGDITILNTSFELSPIYDEFKERFPRIAELGCGEELIRAMALTQAMYDGAQYGLFTDEMDDDREEGLENIVRDLAAGSVGIMASLKVFFSKQVEIQVAREEHQKLEREVESED